MKFHIDIDTDELTGGTEEELGRILRYWAGNLKHYRLDEERSETIHDSAYREVGTWSLG
ncbi:hypothetical protein [Streptomyces sp. ST2-7A]|uniref:hypothetical protein n=1 Tax=Streptomyces sp. ST2-7A TaxID=2907214 RepID=UPI001F376FB3|nr:hypothetical protein [Streptomyces sp. ST2-7A]MCE7080210.1 hypothetical protein [Streptomyces sp. ST2-7A]